MAGLALQRLLPSGFHVAGRRGGTGGHDGGRASKHGCESYPHAE
jgi:hypothetical protein